MKEVLENLSNKEIYAAVQKGMRNVGTKTTRAARRHLRKNHGLDTGQMKKALGIRALKVYRREARVVMWLGPRKGYAIKKKGNKNHDPFYIAHLVEFGHRIAGAEVIAKGASDYTVQKIGKKTLIGTRQTHGYVKPYPFLRPAVDQNKTEFTNQMVAKIRDVLTKARAKSGK